MTINDNTHTIVMVDSAPEPVTCRVSPRLYYNHDATCPVKTTGVLPFTRHDGKIFVLLQCYTDKSLYQDFGGGLRFDDSTTVAAAARECHEESNGVINSDVLEKELSEEFASYHQRGKYLVFFVEISPIHPSVFGTKEHHDDIERTCHWVELDMVRRYHLHPRLKYSEFDSDLRKMI